MIKDRGLRYQILPSVPDDFPTARRCCEAAITGEGIMKPIQVSPPISEAVLATDLQPACVPLDQAPGRTKAVGRVRPSTMLILDGGNGDARLTNPYCAAVGLDRAPNLISYPTCAVSHGFCRGCFAGPTRRRSRPARKRKLRRAPLPATRRKNRAAPPSACFLGLGVGCCNA